MSMQCGFAYPLCHVFPLTHISRSDAGPLPRNFHSDSSPSSSSSMSSVVPAATERALLLATNHSSDIKFHHSNSTHHFPSSTDTHNFTSSVRKPSVTRLPLPGQTVQPGPARPSPGQGQNSNQFSRKRPNVAQIFFEVIGGVAGAVVLLAILRCIYVYRKTPSSRRPPTPEVAQIDRTLALLRTIPWRPPPDPPPPPPYQPAPDYGAVVGAREQEWDTQPPDRLHPPSPAEHGLV